MAHSVVASSISWTVADFKDNAAKRLAL